ncbi:MAG: PAS domain-containing sensor histidine kinase, partial [Mesorhizobium sp.]
FVTTKKQGMGVGLSICRTIVESHGGHIWAESMPGGGTAFRFTLRAVEKDEVARGQ